MTLNPKGGCGKSTLATNLASFFASAGNSVALADLDSQRSSLEWLEARAEEYPAVTGVDGCNGALRVPRACDMLVLDAPAAVHGRDLTALVKRAETIVIPVLPSPMDMRACARFITELLTVGKVSRQQTKLAVVANRVRETTVIYQSLEAFLRKLSIPSSQRCVTARTTSAPPNTVWAFSTSLRRWRRTISSTGSHCYAG
jgi:chromosome partitioning protein